MTEKTVATLTRGCGGHVVHGEGTLRHRVRHHHGLGVRVSYTVDGVLAEAEYGGTHYETLSKLLDKDWGVVVCIADYDSSLRAKEAIARCRGHIELVLDISLACPADLPLRGGRSAGSGGHASAGGTARPHQ
mgnify:CR=1 FL=1